MWFISWSLPHHPLLGHSRSVSTTSLCQAFGGHTLVYGMGLEGLLGSPRLNRAGRGDGPLDKRKVEVTRQPKGGSLCVRMWWPRLRHLKPRRMSVCRELGGGGMEVALNIVTSEGGCMLQNNRAHGGGKMGRANSYGHWIRKDGQRLRDRCHPGEGYRWACKGETRSLPSAPPPEGLRGHGCTAPFSFFSCPPW